MARPQERLPPDLSRFQADHTLPVLNQPGPRLYLDRSHHHLPHLGGLGNLDEMQLLSLPHQLSTGLRSLR